MIEYRLLLPKQHRLFDETDLTFTINHIRSRRPSILYFLLHFYNQENEEVHTYTSPRGVIGTVFSDEGCDYTQTFSIDKDIVLDTVYVQLELRTLGISSENPLYFNELMLQEGTEFNGYHVPRELDKMYKHMIELPASQYANLYDSEGNYLQVIRPNKESFDTNTLNKAQYTILAPHFEDEEEYDNHVAVYLEAMNQTEQKIDVLR